VLLTVANLDLPRSGIRRPRKPRSSRERTLRAARGQFAKALRR